MSLPREKHVKPKRPNMFFRTLMKLVSIPDMKSTSCRFSHVGMEKLGKDERALYIMNHSSFIDLEIVATLMYPRPFNIVATTDGFVGKRWLMRSIGCIPTKKFVNDVGLIRDIDYALGELKSNVVLFPEAGYSLDGRATVLPSSLGMLIKHLAVPVVMVKTFGAFLRDPLYNNLQRRKINVSVCEEYFLSPEEIKTLSCDEINSRINGEFSFDSFAWQKENHVKIDEPFRADGLERILYKCPHCFVEGKMHGEGMELSCRACGASYTLDEYGYLKAYGGKFDHIPSWVDWERECAVRELSKEDYGVSFPVDICMMTGTKHIYHVGEGTLSHTKDGFRLVGCGGELNYEQKPLASYTLNSDFNWYEIGDVIGIGNNDALYFCFPKDEGISVNKLRLLAEELFKMVKDEQKHARECRVKCDTPCFLK